jgi:hypothetical protein
MVTLLERVAGLLTRNRVAYSLIGATAMAVYRVSRATFDMDLFTTDHTVLDSSFWRELVGLGVDVEVRRGDDDDPLFGIVRLFENETHPIDLVVGRGGWQSEIARRARDYVVSNVRIPVADGADIVLLKLYAGGVQDRWDIVQLVAANREIEQQVDERLKALPQACRTLWQSIRDKS